MTTTDRCSVWSSMRRSKTKVTRDSASIKCMLVAHGYVEVH